MGKGERKVKEENGGVVVSCQLGRDSGSGGEGAEREKRSMGVWALLFSL